MSEIRANSITDAAGTGAPNFPNGLSGSGASLTNLPAPTSAQVGTATAGLAAGSVGSYALLNSLSVATRSSGAAVAGSNLRFANTYAEGATVGYSTETPSGTWRLMGNTGNYDATFTSTFNVQASLWLRIS
jgi:hypothetical protein